MLIICHNPVRGELIICFICRELLEEILDDDQELAEINLSSQPSREARQRRRERNRLKREQFANGLVFMLSITS